MQTFTFILWREYKLSIAELLSVFPEWKAVFWDKEFLVLEWISKNNILLKANTLGWTIKIIEMWEDSILKDAETHEWKFRYWINVYTSWKELKEILNKTKKNLKNAWISSRFVNNDFKNLSSAQILWEKLIERWTDYNYITREKNKEMSFWKTIWVQDINAYSKRDFSKDRDMQTGMLPPKLAQIMLNIWNVKTSILDPFVWLWTILIEADLMWFKGLYWSDLNEKMVEYSKKNLKWKWEFEKLNAKFINESKFLSKADLIVTEWYLWEIMTKKNISTDRIQKQKESLNSLYEPFFANLQKANFTWTIVISFPFWEVNWKYVYLTEIYDILNKYCKIQNLLPNDFENLATKAWSLLYKRDNQLVGREVFKLGIRSSFYY
jgi:tRNA G10  N-methylase Trm11